MQHVKTFFVDHHHLPPPKPALSEHSTSNPATSSDHHPHFHSPHLTDIRNNAAAANNAPSLHAAAQEDEEDEDEEEDDQDDEAESDSEAETGRNGRALVAAGPNAPAEPSELMQLEMSEDIRLGSPDDASNNLDSDFNMLAVSQSADQQRQAADSYRAESTRRWPPVQQPMSGVQPPPLGTLNHHYVPVFFFFQILACENWNQTT